MWYYSTCKRGIAGRGFLMYFNQEIKDIIENKTELYSYRLEFLSQKVLLVDKKSYNDIVFGDIFVFNNNEYNKKLLELAVTNEYVYKYICKSINNEVPSFNVASINHYDKNETEKIHTISNYSFINAIRFYINLNNISLTEKEEKRLLKLEKLVNFDTYLKANMNKKINMNIDNINFTFNTYDLIELMNKSKSEFNAIYLDEEITDYKGHNKYRILYAAIQFFIESSIINIYNLPDNIKEKFNESSYMYDIDVEAINKVHTPFSVYSKDIELNKEVEDVILGSIPKNLSTLENVIYVYNQICKIFKPDPIFFTNDNHAINREHDEESFLESISLDNYLISSKNFMFIFTKLLEKMQVNYQLKFNISNESAIEYKDFFASKYCNIIIKCNKYLIEVNFLDALYIDAALEKSPKDFIGFKCVNENEHTQKSYQKKIDNFKENVDSIKNGQYINVVGNKLKEFILQIESMNLNCEGKLCYLLNYYYSAFTEKELKKNIKLLDIKNSVDDKGESSCEIIFVVNNNKIQKNMKNSNKYYKYNINQGLIEIELNEVKKLYEEKSSKAFVRTLKDDIN